MTEGVTVTRGATRPQHAALIGALCDACRDNAGQMPIDHVLSCFITVMRTSAYFSGVPREAFDRLLQAAVDGNAEWWQRVDLDVSRPKGEA